VRLLFVYDAIYPDHIGGVEHRNFQLARALAERGHEITLAGWWEQEPPATPGIRHLRLGAGPALYNAEGRRSTLAALRLARAVLCLDLRGYDAVETANIPYVHVAPLALEARLRGVPLIVTWHEYWGRYWREYVPGPAWPAYAAVELATAQLGTRVVSPSQLTAKRVARRRLRQTGGVIPNGIPLADIRAAAEPHRGDGPPLISCGRLLREKRIDLLLDAIAILRTTHAGPLLTITGEGPDGERLRAHAAALGLDESVVFAGKLARAEGVWAAMSRAQVAVQPSSREGFGLFPMEAMAAGLPVVYCESSESAVPEIVRHDREGLRVAAEASRLAATLARVLDDGVLRARLAANAHRRAEAYDWTVIAARFERMVEALLRGR
jgi:glycosyltransferase involved in cell wall biosynthesis